MQQSDKILILFEGHHLAYSPTVIQLYDALAATHQVTVLAERSEKFIKQKLSGREVIYYTIKRRKPTFIYKAWYLLLSLFDPEARLLRKQQVKFQEYRYRFRLVKQLIRSGLYQRVIAVDLKNLFYCSLLKQEADLVSLELGPGEHLLPLIDHRLINAVIIQTRERLDHLFRQMPAPVFYVQNAPVYHPITIPEKKKGILFGGTAWAAFGIYACLDYLRAYEKEIITIQGAVPDADRKRITRDYADLLSSGRLVINETYLENDEVVSYFSQFEIGVCFYDLSIDWMNHFNYRSAPSGKVFKYLAAGVPVVVSDIIGFRFVKEMECGTVTNSLDAEQIHSAIEKIRANYALYSTRAIEAAKFFSFDAAVQPYLDFVRGTNTARKEIGSLNNLDGRTS